MCILRYYYSQRSLYKMVISECELFYLNHYINIITILVLQLDQVSVNGKAFRKSFQFGKLIVMFLNVPWIRTMFPKFQFPSFTFYLLIVEQSNDIFTGIEERHPVYTVLFNSSESWTKSPVHFRCFSSNTLLLCLFELFFGG